jgi:hypothetical protein
MHSTRRNVALLAAKAQGANERGRKAAAAA